MAFPVTPFIECPNCHKLLEVYCTQCTECRELIPEDYATLSVATNVLNTVACNRAKEIHGGTHMFGLIAIGLSVATYLIDRLEFHSKLLLFWFSLPLPLLWISVAGTWLLRFRRFAVFGDAAFHRATRQVTQSVVMAFSILALQILVIIISYRP